MQKISFPLDLASYRILTLTLLSQLDLTSSLIMKKYIAEFIGTFFLVFTIGNVIATKLSFAPLAIGLTLMTMIYANAHLSGSHFNPAVTLALWLRGVCPKSDVIPYLIAQFTAAVVAAFVVNILRGAIHPPQSIDYVQVIIAEFLGTFALVWVILNVATTKKNANNAFYGVSIGLTVAAGAATLGDLSGAVFNPAVAFGAVVLGVLHIKFLFLYSAIAISAGVAAALLFKGIKADG